MILPQIHNMYHNLTTAEKRIANYILEHPTDVLNMTINVLAEHCNTAPSAVNRFCKAIQVDSFSKLKILLAQEVGKQSKQELLPAFSQEDDEKLVFKKVFRSGMKALEDTLSILKFDEIDTICKKMCNAKRIFVFGVGTSSVIATDAAYRISQVGIPAYAYTDILFMNVSASNMQEGDLAIGISHSGRTKPVVDAMRQARAMGAETIAITSYSASILSLESDYSIIVYPDEENYPVEAVSARVAHLCVVDALMMTLATMKHDDFATHIASRNKALEEMRYK